MSRLGAQTDSRAPRWVDSNRGFAYTTASVWKGAVTGDRYQPAPEIAFETKEKSDGRSKV